MNRKVLEVVVAETPSQPPVAEPEDSEFRVRAEPRSSALAREVSRLGAFLESDDDESEADPDGDPTVIRSRREALELREYLRHEEGLRDERRREEQLREEQREARLREESREHSVRESLTRAVEHLPQLGETERARTEQAEASDADDAAVVSDARRVGGGRRWLVVSALGAAVALGGFALLLAAQGARRPGADLPLANAAPSPAPRESGGVIPTMQLDVVHEVEVHEAEALDSEAHEADAPQANTAPVQDGRDDISAPALEAPPPAAPGEHGAFVPNEDAVSAIARAEALLRSDHTAEAAQNAKDMLEQVIAVQRDNPHAHASLAEACLRLRDAACARAAATRAVKLRPKREAYLLLEAKVQAAFSTP